MKKFDELYEQFGRSDADRANDVVVEKNEDVLYDIKDEEPTIPEIEKTQNTGSTPALSDEDMTKLAAKLAEILAQKKGEGADGSN